MARPVLLDLFCGAGGCSVGYHRAGFDVVGVDIAPQKHYPFEFHQMDAFEFLDMQDLTRFAAIHASPPCQRYSVETPPTYRDLHPDLIEAVRLALQKTGKLYAIENVENARALLVNPVMLCGSMFGLNVWRHRYFEIWPRSFILTPPCNHSGPPVLITGTTRRSEKNGGRFEYSVQECRDASGLGWMTRTELDEAIPPTYTEFIGKQLIAILQGLVC